MKKLFVLFLLVCILLAGCKDTSQKETESTKNNNKKSIVAVEVGKHSIDTVELNYFYIDAITTFYNNYQDYISYLLDIFKPLNKQIADPGTGETWADYFVKQAYENIKSTYAVYDAAMAAGYTLDATTQAEVDETIKYLDLYATLYGFKNTDAYLRDVFGPGANVESYTEYYTKCAIADAYYTKYAQDLNYTIEELNAYQSNQSHKFNSYSFATYYLAVNRFYAPDAGIMGEDGKYTYSKEETQAAVKAAKEAADVLAAGLYETVEDFDIAINNLDVNKADQNRTAEENEEDEKEEPLKFQSTKYEEILYSNVNVLFRDFVSGKSGINETGDLTVIESSSGEGENKIVNGFYVVRYDSSTDNDFSMKNVRHILVKFVKLDSNGKPITSIGPSNNVTYTDDEKKYAKDEAEKLWAQWHNGEKTEETFAALANKESDDGDGTTGGLYENVYPGQMVEAFDAWCYDPNRHVGDIEIIETEYGYHIMYFVGNTEQTYRNYLITETMRAEDTQEWYTALVEAISFNSITEKYINKAITIA